MNKDDKFRDLESGSTDMTNIDQGSKGRVIQDFSGNHWLMERMRPGQGVAEGIGLLKNELSGNNFSWNAATVPGDVYTDLYHAGEIDDPFWARNMGKCKWVQDYEWWYNYAFNVSDEFKGKDITLIFEGVDYSCEVWLNGEYLGKHEGMMSQFKFDVTKYIDFNSPHVPNNLLAIKLDPPPKNQKNFAGLKHNFAGDYLTGVIPFGIWQPIKLIATDSVRIENYRVESEVLEDNTANVKFDVEITTLEEKYNKVNLDIEISREDKKYNISKEITLSKGSHIHSLDISIKNADLWWPYELGKPNLYDLNVKVTKDNSILDNLKDRFGIREIQMKMNPGFTEDEAENPWTFVINGKEMFLRSACWGGQPSFFYGRNSEEKYRFYLEKAKECNINNLRIFGWHPAETKEFYDICDELGITVWTNFSFATQVFRDDEEYLNKVDKEISEVVKVRRNHPSTLMWMGGEEVYFSEAHVESNNRKLMERIGRITKSLTNVPYADASPLSSREGIRMGYKSKESAHANSHYYAAGAIFMEDFYPNLDYCIIPELTAASSPNVSSLKKFIPENELWPMGLSYGYHAADVDILKILNFEVFNDEKTSCLEEFVEATQIAQGTIFQFALEHFRRCKPHVSGVALCHFITNWPIIKWDIIDYYGEKKKSFDFVKKSYQPLLPSLKFEKRRWLPNEDFKSELWIVNDYYKKYDNLKLNYKILDESKRILLSDCLEVNVEENSSNYISGLQFNMKEIQGETFNIELELINEDNEVLANNEYVLLVGNQEEAKLKAMELYNESRDKRNKYGRGYYRYALEAIDNR